MAVALLFVSAGVSFAHDPKGGHHKSSGNAYGHYKKAPDPHPGLYKKHLKPGYHFRDRFRHRVIRKVHHRHPRRSGTIVGFKVKDQGYKIAVIVKDHR
jgi:hypothetical protein